MALAREAEADRCRAGTYTALIQAHYHAVLEQNQATMSSDLLDAEGFPRADLDIPTIRQARNQVQRLRNDRREADEQLAALLTQALPPHTPSQPQAVAAAQRGTTRARPMAVRSVAPKGPAARAVRRMADSRASKQAISSCGGVRGTRSRPSTWQLCPPL